MPRARPDDCCTVPIDPAPMPAADRAVVLARGKALADPSRLDILWLISAQEEPICACDVVDRIPLSQPTISHHLKVLVDAGLITVSRRGVWAYYALAPQSHAFVQAVLGVSEAVPIGNG